MAKAYECDRCGVLFTKEKDEKDKLDTTKLFVAKMNECYCTSFLDLCYVCQSKFEAWWNEGKEEDKKENEESEY